MSTNVPGFPFKGLVHLTFLHANAVLFSDHLLQLMHVASEAIV